MARPFEFETPEECIHHHVSIYYEEYAKDPDIRFKPEEHIALADSINVRYLKELSRNKDFDYDTYAGAFIECIDFLTKIYSKKQKQEDSLERKKKLLSKFQ
jgi:hypothetical protein